MGGLPPIQLQEKFAKFVRAIEAMRVQMLGKLDAYAELQTVIAQQALVGDLTIAWRDAHATQIAEAARGRDNLLRERGAKISVSATAVVEPAAQADLPAHRARHWLLGELSEFQRQVLSAFTEYCQATGEPLLVEDPDVFARFCDDGVVSERLQAFGTSHGNRIRRSLSQLAALGLISKVTMPKDDPETGAREYLKAFRLLRSVEFTRMADVQDMRKALVSSNAVEEYSFQIQLDYETSERAGAGGMFQVIAIEDHAGKDFTHLVDQARHYESLDELRGDLATSLDVQTARIKLEVE